MKWDHEVHVLKAHGLTYGDWAILITAGYYIPVAGERFIEQATWEIQKGAKTEDVREGYDRCLTNGWVRLVREGHMEHDIDVFGMKTGDITEYPENGVILTEAGHALHSKVAIEIFGADYFRNWQPSPQDGDED